MPTTMPVTENFLRSEWILPLIGALVGGFFTVLATWVTLRHELKKIRLQEMTRLRWTKRWAVIEESYSLLVKAYYALRRLLHPQGEAPAREAIDEAWKAWTAFNDCYAQCSVFLPKRFAVRIGNISKEFHLMTYDLSQYAKALYSDHRGADGDREFLTKFKRKHEKSLVDGDMNEKIEQLTDDLRAYLDQGESG